MTIPLIQLYTNGYMMVVIMRFQILLLLGIEPILAIREL
jgi:hypothetical protein